MLELYRDSLADLLARKKGEKKGNRKIKLNKGKSSSSNGGDMMQGKGSGTDGKLLIKKDDRGRVYVQGAVLAEVSTEQELYEVFAKGQKNRATRSTAMVGRSLFVILCLSVLTTSTSQSHSTECRVITFASRNDNRYPYQISS